MTRPLLETKRLPGEIPQGSVKVLERSHGGTRPHKITPDEAQAIHAHIADVPGVTVLVNHLAVTYSTHQHPMPHPATADPDALQGCVIDAVAAVIAPWRLRAVRIARTVTHRYIPPLRVVEGQYGTRIPILAD